MTTHKKQNKEKKNVMIEKKKKNLLKGKCEPKWQHPSRILSYQQENNPSRTRGGETLTTDKLLSNKQLSESQEPTHCHRFIRWFFRLHFLDLVSCLSGLALWSSIFASSVSRKSIFYVVIYTWGNLNFYYTSWIKCEPLCRYIYHRCCSYTLLEDKKTVMCWKKCFHIGFKSIFLQNEVTFNDWKCKYAEFGPWTWRNYYAKSLDFQSLRRQTNQTLML